MQMQTEMYTGSLALSFFHTRREREMSTYTSAPGMRMCAELVHSPQCACGLHCASGDECCLESKQTLEPLCSAHHVCLGVWAAFDVTECLSLPHVCSR